MGQRLGAALEELYRVFSVQPKPLEIDACPCCVEPDQVRVLLTTPLREIGADQLSNYASSAFFTVGDEADFRYFLPRILDISLNDRSWWPDLEVVLHKLSLANWQRWPPHEIAVLHTLFETGFEEAIEAASADGRHLDVDSWICGLALADVDLEPFLLKLESPASLDALIEFVERNADGPTVKALSNAFWDGHREQAALVIAWLNSPNVQSAVRRAGKSR